MAYKPVDRSFTKEYLDEQHKVMRWLFSQGLKIEEIRELSFGNIDIDSEEIVVVRKESEAHYYSGIGSAYIDTWDSEFRIKVKGIEHEFYLLKKRFVSCYLFTREYPRSWRKEIAKDSLYSLSEIQKICDVNPQLSKNVLTFPAEFATIGLTKLNITNSKAKGAYSS